jgi:hypothetical protein
MRAYELHCSRCGSWYNVDRVCPNRCCVVGGWDIDTAKKKAIEIVKREVKGAMLSSDIAEWEKVIQTFRTYGNSNQDIKTRKHVSNVMIKLTGMGGALTYYEQNKSELLLQLWNIDYGSKLPSLWS